MLRVVAVSLLLLSVFPSGGYAPASFRVLLQVSSVAAGLSTETLQSYISKEFLSYRNVQIVSEKEKPTWTIYVISYPIENIALQTVGYAYAISYARVHYPPLFPREIEEFMYLRLYTSDTTVEHVLKTVNSIVLTFDVLVASFD